MNSIEIKSVHSGDSSSNSHVELTAAPALPGTTETPPPEAPPPEAPLPQEHAFGPVADLTMSSNNSTSTTQVQARDDGETFLQREWQTIFRVKIVLLATISGCVGGFLRHDANLGLGIGAGVLAGLLVLFEVLKHKLRRARQRLVSQSWWPTSNV
ncbi:hypothetical protein J3E69DRAFT_174891 [Trichoderma sp. SZMC 28015]